ncbi:MAG: hypothetical protein AAFZ65_11615 [Planctomycetota bacterium]
MDELELAECRELAMQHLDPNANRPTESSAEPRPSGADSTGLVHFLVESTSAAGLTREALVRAVRSLNTEREYLRRVRDQRAADYEGVLRDLRGNVAELEAVLEQQRAAYREELRALQAELDANRDLLAVLEQEREVLSRDLDAWRARATRTLWESVRRTFEGLTRVRDSA